MSKIDDLIQELCPDGVEFVELCDILSYEQPGKYIVSSTKYDDSYPTPVLTAGQSFYLGFTDETEGIFEASNDNPVIIFDDFTTSFHWVDFSFKVKSSAMKMLRLSNDCCLFRYVYHVMKNIRYAPVDHSRQWIGVYSKFKIPVPPMEIQEEIVRILDSFTELEKELEKELSLRQKQYEYYRDYLMTSYMGGDFLLGNLVGMKAGKSVSASDVSKTVTDSHVIGCYGGGGLRGYVEKPNNEVSRILIGRQGANCGKVFYAEAPFYATEHAVVVLPSDLVDERYLEHMLQWKDLSSFKTAGAQPGLSVAVLKQVHVTIPGLGIQKNIGKTLDCLRSLMTNGELGICSELQCRRKQYEYYRDKLLTFKEKVS